MKQLTHKTESFSPYGKMEREELDIPYERRRVFEGDKITQFNPDNSEHKALFREFEERMNSKDDDTTKEDLTNFNRIRLNNDSNLYVGLGRPSSTAAEYASMNSMAQFDQDGNQRLDDSSSPLADPKRFMLKLNLPNADTRQYVPKEQNMTPRSAVNHELWHRDAVGYILQNPTSTAKDTLAKVEHEILFAPQNYSVADLIYKNLDMTYGDLLSRPGGQNELSANWIGKIGAAGGALKEKMRANLENRDKRAESADDVSGIYDELLLALKERDVSLEDAKKMLLKSLPYKKQRDFFSVVQKKAQEYNYPKSFTHHIDQLRVTSKGQQDLATQHISDITQDDLDKFNNTKGHGKKFNDFVNFLMQENTPSYGENTRILEAEVKQDRLARQAKKEEEEQKSYIPPPQFFDKRNKQVQNFTGNRGRTALPAIQDLKIRNKSQLPNPKLQNSAGNSNARALKMHLNPLKLNSSYNTKAVISSKDRPPVLNNKNAPHRKLIKGPTITKRARGGEVTRLDLYRALAASMSPYNTYSDLI